MKKFTPLFSILIIISFHSLFAQTTGIESRMNEVFQVSELSSWNNGTTLPSTVGNTRFYDPWEVTYGPDDSLWVTEAKNYRVYKVSPVSGNRRKILDIYSSATSTLPAGSQSFDLSFPTKYPSIMYGGYAKTGGTNPPQGGFAGLAIHPKFLSGSPYVFVSYVWKFVKNLSTAGKTIQPNAGNTDTVITSTPGTPANGGVYYKNALVRFTYDFTSGMLGSPMMVCDTLPGSSDHNSQRVIIAPIDGTYYLFYANGDMGAGQFGNAARVENAQNLDSYEGKILRFNIDPDGDAGSYDQWIPNTNPFNASLGKQSAVWAYGFRNNQGFAYAYINGSDHLYGQMHGPFSDDEINVIHGGGNYGHPLVVGFKKDGNYNSAAAGNPPTAWTDGSGKVGGLPVIVNEENNADSMNKFNTYYDPIYTYYPASQGSTSTPSSAPVYTVQRMYYDFNHGNQSNTYWPSEAPSGMDVYTYSVIPGWKNSLISSVMKGAPLPNTTSGATQASGKLMRLKLNTNGDNLAVSVTNADSTLKSASAFADDTVSYFAGQNRFRDIAISKDGLSLFAIIDSSSTTSGPTTTNPANSLCKGCLLKFTFLGYHTKTIGLYPTSSLPDTIPVGTAGTYNTCVSANSIVINSSNDTLWVPITDTNSNVIAELNANGNVLDTVTTSYFLNSGAVRETSKHTLYLDRSITITPKNQPVASKPVHIRLYITNAEYTALANAHNSLGQSSSITGINNVGIFKTSDVCGGTYSNTGSTVIADTPFTRTTTAGATGYALQGSITHFSTFYFANGAQTLPLKLISFTGAIKNNISQLQWITENETGTKEFAVERSTDGVQFDSIGVESANGTDGTFTYDFNDASVSQLTCPAVYYRLKIIDDASDYTYSDIIKLPLSSVTGSISVRPNPAINSATVQINAVGDDNANWDLIDNTGATVLHGSTFLRKGNNSFDINLSSLPTGMYYLKISGNFINQGIKVSKL